MGQTGAGAVTNRFWFYTNSATDDITAENFFNAAEAQISTGDLLYSVSNGQMARMVNTSGVISLAALDVDPTA
jgi:hypothetical protein